MACANALCNSADDPVAPFDVLNSEGLFPGADFVIAGAGTRDLDIRTVPANFSVTIPDSTIHAYLYWNLFVANDFPADSQAVIKINGGESQSRDGTLIAWTNNSCWSQNQCILHETMSVTLSNASGCSCIEGTYELGYDSGSQKWTNATSPFSVCSGLCHLVINVSCDSITGKWTVEIKVTNDALGG